jgi:thiol-disulfide isomerase/thioredoxin
VGRTITIVVVFVAITAAAGILLTKRLAYFGETSSAPRDVQPIASGRGVTIKLSDKPTALPALDLVDLDGRAIPPESWRGKVVVVNFWATWCGPCREEIPALVALQDRYRDHLVVLGLSIDQGPAAGVKAYVERAGVNYPVAIVSEAIQNAFGGIPAVPSTFIVNRTGGIVQRHVGLINPIVTEHEVRSLAALPTDATVEVVQDTGQVLLENAAYATEIPGLDLSALSPVKKEALLERLNTEHCTCGCGLTVAQCRINDPSCEVSLPLAKAILKEIQAAR